MSATAQARAVRRNSEASTPPASEPEAVALARKVEFLSRPSAYPHTPAKVDARETHMSWVFLAGSLVYKLKKPVRFPYLDFSTLARRTAACRAELRLNRRLAPDVYVELAALTAGPRGLAINGDGPVVDWLVVMRRLDERDTLERAIEENRLKTWQLDRLVATLVQFYRRAEPSLWAPSAHLRQRQEALAYNRRVLLDARLGLPAGLVHRIDRVLRQFIARRRRPLLRRLLGRHVVDGHGDLRPEHIWLGDPVRIIDCLEFNEHLRAVDPFEEIAFLSVECERLGAAWAGRYVRRRAARALHDAVGEPLYLFYRCQRATLRARLAIAHMLEPNPRTPEKWPRLARLYLQIATADATRLERLLKARGGR